MRIFVQRPGKRTLRSTQFLLLSWLCFRNLQQRQLCLLAGFYGSQLFCLDDGAIHKQQFGSERGRSELLVDAAPLEGLLQAELAVDPPILPQLLQQQHPVHMEHQPIFPHSFQRLPFLALCQHECREIAVAESAEILSEHQLNQQVCFAVRWRWSHPVGL